MTAFELKPSAQPGLGSTADSIKLEPVRSEIPVLLINFVSLQQWQQTFDAVYNHYEHFLNEGKALIPWVFIPCCICCMLPTLSAMNKRLEEGWIELCRQEQERYRAVGIQVSLYREISGWGAGSSRHVSNNIVGVKFDIPAHGITTGGASGGEDYAKQLDTLNHLHKSGGLSDTEFEIAKSKVIAKM